MASTFTPQDWINLISALFYGAAIVCVPIATVYTMIAAARSKRAEEASKANAALMLLMSADVVRLEKNTNSISERNQAIAQRLGITEGIALERASTNASNEAAAVATAKVVETARDAAAGTPPPKSGSYQVPHLGGTLPLPVTDRKTEEGLAKVVDAIKENTEEKKKS